MAKISAHESIVGTIDVREMIDTRTSIVTTDENRAYNGLNNIVMHRWINHSVSYSERDLFSAIFGAIHTNTIESFWAIVKRALYGQFHHVSRKYWPLYLNELTCMEGGFALLLPGSVQETAMGEPTCPVT